MSQLAQEQVFLELADIEKELAEFEKAERQKLNLGEDTRQWHDPNPQNFDKAQRAHTTILIGGLTIMQDRLLEAGLTALGYKIQALDCPDQNAFQTGKEYGNRGQCNPTYFTVGNLVQYLIKLRDEQGMSTQEIVDKHLFVTAGACGPCRFGTYVTEYRKALRDAGFEGFRVFLFKTDGGFNQSDADQGLAFTPKFFTRMFQCIILGDILNMIGYRIRPYEIEEGATDRALEQCRDILCDAMRNKKWLMLGSLYRCRKVLNKIKVDRMQPKPKVCVIGEFWAMTTEGDGNYRMQRFLEKEGAEVEIQPVTNWLLYVLWQDKYDAQWLLNAKNADRQRGDKVIENPLRTIRMLKILDRAITGIFYAYAKILGLKNYELANMDEIAELSQDYYNNQLRGGEGHMEVGKLIKNVKKNRSHMVLSIKPFGCMPSSGVSDGVQSLIVSKFPSANFIPIETSGDSAVNAYSRVQMALFKAKQKAKQEFEAEVTDNIRPAYLKKVNQALYYPKPVKAGTAASICYQYQHS